LVRRKTTPEDIRRACTPPSPLGTLRGGIYQPCGCDHVVLACRIVGAADLDVDERKRTITGPDGRTFKSGDMVTVDGSTGQVLAGEPAMVEAFALDEAFQTLLSWPMTRDIGSPRQRRHPGRCKRPVPLPLRASDWSAQSICFFRANALI
jgi:pyruvate,orthophosphate dikinase